MIVKKGTLIDLVINKYAFEGKGITRIDKNIFDNLKVNEETNESYVVFVNGAYPGDVVKAKLKKIKKTYAEADTIEIITPSVDRVKPECKYFGVCGGCKQQDLNYDKQVHYKQLQVIEIFEKLGGFKNFIIEPIFPSKKIFFYRNKMEFSFAQQRWLTEEEIKSGKEIDRNFALGLHIPGMYDKVLDIDECFLQSEISNSILNLTRNFFKEKDTPVYSTKTHTGYLRHLMIRQSSHKKDLMINLVTNYEDDLLMKEYTDIIIKNIPRVTTIVNNINTKKASVATGDYEKVFYGNGFIYDKIGSYTFRISANSFFQTNTIQAENLYSVALEFAALKGSEIVYDLYSGAGTIAIYISSEAKSVFAFESVESAVNDAQFNVEANNISNVKFYTADLYHSFLPLITNESIPLPDVIILDPPRSGMHKNTVDDILKLLPGKIVYVSCNPASQTRDIKLLCDGGYKLQKLKPIDMFPHTYHIENVALLIRNDC